MDFQSMYKSKFMTLDGVYGLLKSNDLIYSAAATAEPVTFLRNLPSQKGKLHNLTIHINLAMANLDMYSNEEYRDLVNVQASFFSRFFSPLQKIGRSTYMPTHLRNMGTDPLYNYKRTGRPLNVFIAAVSPMDQHGYFTTGSFANYNRDMIEYADLVILEVNEKLPKNIW